MNRPSSSSARLPFTVLMERVLRHESELAASLHACQWRVSGSPLQSVKRLFAEQRRQIDRWLDRLAQAARSIGLGLRPPGEDQRADGNAGVATPRAAMVELLRRHEMLMRELRSAADHVAARDPHGDAASLLNGLLEFHATSAWMLRLLLENSDRAGTV